VDFTTLVEGYLLTCRTEGKSAKTCDLYERFLHRFDTYLDKVGIVEIGNVEADPARKFLGMLCRTKKWSTHPVIPAQEDTVNEHTVHILYSPLNHIRHR
jgi:site-specific recombinase XerD